MGRAREEARRERRTVALKSIFDGCICGLSKRIVSRSEKNKNSTAVLKKKKEMNRDVEKKKNFESLLKKEKGKTNSSVRKTT